MTLVERIKGDKWVITCSSCSEDQKLFPLGSITGDAWSLARGSCSCLCAKTPFLSEEQNKLLIIRECSNRDYKFLGWEGEYTNKQNTAVRVLDLKTQKEERLGSINSFLAGCDGYSRVSGHKGSISESKIKPLQHYIDLFMSTGSFITDTIFTRDTKPSTTGRYERWFVECPTCKEDEYSRAGLCTGIFSASYMSLKQGNNPCRCRQNIYLTPEQYNFKLENIVTSEGGTFLGFDSPARKQNAKFRWLCPDGHMNCSSINNYLRGRRCKDSCRYKNAAEVNRYGMYIGREDHDDTLYLIRLFNDNESFIKIGRSFNMRVRMWSIGRYYDVEILSTVQDNHSSVLELESSLHRDFRRFHYTPKISFKGGMFECMSLEVLEDQSVKEIFSLN